MSGPVLALLLLLQTVDLDDLHRNDAPLTPTPA